jgi:AraC-like DNA-binding protein
MFMFGSRIFGQDSMMVLLPNRPVEAETYALSYHKRALEIGNDSLLAQSYHYLGMVNYYLSRPYLSNQYYRRALESPFGRRSKLMQEKCWNNMGINHALTGEYTLALDAYLKSLRLSEEKGDAIDIAKTWLNISELYIQQKINYKEAEQQLESALDVFAKAGDSLSMAIAYQNLGTLYLEQRNYPIADLYTRRSQELYQQLGNWYGALVTRNNIGHILLMSGQIGKARQLFDNTLEEARHRNIDNLQISLLFNIGNAYEKRADYAEAMLHFEQALTIAQKSAHYQFIGSALFELLTTAGKMNNTALVDNYKLKYQKWQHTSRNHEQNAILQELRLLYDFDKLHLQLNEQEQRLRQRRQQIQLLAIIVILVILAGLTILLYAARNRRLMKHLYQRIQEQEAKPAAGAAKDNDSQMLRSRQLFDKIQALVDTQKLYLESELTLSELSRRLGTNETYVSIAINTIANSNFNNYLNRLRVREARRLLRASALPVPWRELYLACGFNSKSSFYRIFKQETGLSPAEYRTMANAEGSTE